MVRDNDNLKNEALLKKKMQVRQLLEGPLVGDFILLSDGTFDRLTHDWGDTIQTGGHQRGSFFLHDSGEMTYSGGLNPSIPKSALRPTGQTRVGRTWFFDEDWAGADRGVYFSVECNVWKVIDEKVEQQVRRWLEKF
jgi:hypothetical protein